MPEQIAVTDLKAVTDYVAQNGSVTNRECRELTRLGYDSSIKIFGALCALGALTKSGEGSGTRYVLPHGSKAKDKPMNEQITIEHLGAVMAYVVKQGSVTNRECREITGLSYNSAIRIFAALCSLSMLRKTGTTSTTKYVVGGHAAPSLPRPGYHRKTAL